jgi:hypothetical protein
MTKNNSLYHRVLSRCLACACLTDCSPLPLLLQGQEPSIYLAFFSLAILSPSLSRFALPDSACPAAPLHSRIYLSKTQRPACAVRYDNWARLHTDIAARVFFTLRVSR